MKADEGNGIMSIDLFKKPTHLIARDADDILGVTTAGELQSKLELICAEIKHPVALYCFYDYEQERDENGQPIFMEGLPIIALENGRPKMVRFDSNLASVTLHWCCETFRICAGCNYCIKSNYDHACLFRNVEEKSGTYIELPTEITSLDEFEQLINMQIDNFLAKDEQPIYHSSVIDDCGEDATRPKFVRVGDSCYIDYRCSMMGYHELIFPVIVYGRVLGVIFCGQITKAEDCDTLCKTIRRNFLDNHPNLFTTYNWDAANTCLDRRGTFNETRLRNHLLAGIDRYKAVSHYPAVGPDNPETIQPYINFERSVVLSPRDFNSLVNRANDQIARLASNLEETLRHRRKEYIARSIRLAIQEFNSKIPTILRTIGTNAASITDYWKTVESLLEPLIHQLPIREFMIFGASSVSMGAGNFATDEWLPCVAFLHSAPYYDLDYIKSFLAFKVFASDKDQAKFLLTSHRIEEYDLERPITRLIERVYESSGCVFDHCAYSEPADYTLSNVFYIPVRDNLSHSSAIAWRFHGKENALGLLLDTEYIEEEIRKELVQLATLIFYVNWYLLDSILQTNTELVLRFFRHEIAHVLLGFGSLNNNYIMNDSFGSLPHDKRQDIAGDFRTTEDMLRYIEQNIQLLTKPPDEMQIQKDRFLLFKEILIKWDLMYRETLKHKHLRINMPRVSMYDDYRPVIYSDRRLVEQIVYNIVSNAVKYCYWGSNIYIDCQKPNFEASYQTLTVKDFGHHMPQDQNRAYELYFREPDPRLNIDGSGIGLYVVKKICDLLGFKVSHSCVWISNYNVPLIDEYLCRVFRIYPKDEQLAAALSAEEKRIGPIKMREIVCGGRPFHPLKDKQLIDMIHFPTYEVTISVKIPIYDHY